jgi:HAD superfamily hydrolase (TIGR01509 family)
MKNKNYLICFDLDGILLDSMTIANQIFFEMVESELGLSTEEIKNDKTKWAIAAKERFAMFWKDEIKEKGITQKQIDDLMSRFRIKKREADTPIIPDARKAVEMVAEHFENLASVSSNSDKTLDYSLNKIDLRKYFKKITGTDGIKHSKPHPEIYQKTIEYFNIQPDHALTVEDSTPGITSAKRAGMKAIGVTTGVEKIEDLKKTEADYILNDLSELTLDLVYSLLEINS